MDERKSIMALGTRRGALLPQTRQLLEQLDAYVTQRAEADGIERLDIRFTQTELREALSGCFLTRDPLAFRGGDKNVYRYVSTSPLDRIDPTGLGEWGYYLDDEYFYEEPLPPLPDISAEEEQGEPSGPDSKRRSNRSSKTSRSATAWHGSIVQASWELE